MPDETYRHEHPQPRQPAVVDGEVVDVRPSPPSPLDPDEDGVWPTVLRPTPIAQPLERRRGR